MTQEVRDRQCKGKVRCLSMEEASRAAKTMRKKFRKIRFNAYKCVCCPYFHVGRDRSKRAALKRNIRLGKEKR